jgi:hypothetical protein
MSVSDTGALLGNSRCQKETRLLKREELNAIVYRKEDFEIDLEGELWLPLMASKLLFLARPEATKLAVENGSRLNLFCSNKQNVSTARKFITKSKHFPDQPSVPQWCRS